MKQFADVHYRCSPDVTGCHLCDETDTVHFSLDTENFC